MIPVSLNLRNFLSYGEDVPTLDFTGFQLACVTGRNGHGKSALFDAITWALWGEARKASSDRKPDEGLLRIGASDLRVDFTFDLDGQRFRVNRSFRETARSGTSSLELQIFDPATDRYRALSESSSIRKTQARINTLIRVSYDTFVNSAFILQGKTDAFTRRSPSERKAILSEILELSRFDVLGASARNRAQESEANGIRARADMDRIEAAFIQSQQLKSRLILAKERLADSEKVSEHAERHLEACNRSLARAEADQAQRTALTAERDGLLLRKVEMSKEMTATREEEKAALSALASRDHILADLETLKTCRKQEARLTRVKADRQEMEVTLARLEAEVDAARQKVVTRQEHWKTVVADLTHQITDGQTQLARQPAIQKMLAELEAFKQQDRNLLDLSRKREGIEKQRREIERSYNKDRSDIQVEIETAQAKRRELRTMLDRRTELECTFNETRQHLDTFTALTENMEGVKRDGTDAQQTEEHLKERIEGLGKRRQQFVSQLNQLDEHGSPDCPLCGSDLDETHRQEVIDQLRKEEEQLGWEHEAASKSMAEARDIRDECRVAYQRLRDQMHPLADTPRLFAQAEAELKQVSRVDQDLETLVLTTQTAKDNAKTFEVSSPAALALADLREQIKALTAETDRHDTIRKEIEIRASAEVEIAKLDSIQIQLDRLRKQLPEAEKKLKTATDWLELKHYAIDAQTTLAEVRGRLGALPYDASAHEALTARIEALSLSERLSKNLQQAEQDLAVTRARIEAFETRGTELSRSIALASEQLQKFDDIDTQIAAYTEACKKSLTALRTTRESRDLELRNVAGLERDEEACQHLEAGRQTTAAALSKSEKDTRIYRELVKAFGRDGIQALLIDQVIPELQDEANRILSRLTSNNTQVTLESLGELKTGGTKETLDIRISDEIGERRYELYSGGETFRVDFAIRIALSKLLARRSGTPLQTLVIDEGFGTQDEEGLARLVEAIQTISDEFEKILVITHVEAIKNAFPVRIEVVKHADSGSSFTIVR